MTAAELELVIKAREALADGDVDYADELLETLEIDHGPTTLELPRAA